jgi:hypothetical protein
MNILIACSAVLLVVAATMWCRSYVVADRLTYTTHDADGQWVVRRSLIKFLFPVTIAKAVEARSVDSRNGRITLSRVGFIIPDGQRLLAPGEPEPDYRADFPYTGAEHAGFTWEHPASSWTSPESDAMRPLGRYEHSWMLSHGYWAAPAWHVHAAEYEIHYWLLVTLLGIAPLWRIVSALRRRRRVASGHCTNCGYDLRATPDRCPECGGAAINAATDAVPAAR